MGWGERFRKPPRPGSAPATKRELLEARAAMIRWAAQMDKALEESVQGLERAAAAAADLSRARHAFRKYHEHLMAVLERAVLAAKE